MGWKGIVKATKDSEEGIKFVFPMDLKPIGENTCQTQIYTDGYGMPNVIISATIIFIT